MHPCVHACVCVEEEHAKAFANHWMHPFAYKEYYFIWEPLCDYMSMSTYILYTHIEIIEAQKPWKWIKKKKVMRYGAKSKAYSI